MGIKGTYQVLYRLERDVRLEKPSRGRKPAPPKVFDLRAGFYVYTGSAFQPSGLAGRLGHHLAVSDRPFHDVDYLRLRAKPVRYRFHEEVEPGEECLTAAATLLMPGASPVRRLPDETARSMGFGCCNCIGKCPSHLAYFFDEPPYFSEGSPSRPGWRTVAISPADAPATVSHCHTGSGAKPEYHTTASGGEVTDPSDDRAIAIHEAAHAVLACRSRWMTLERVDLDRNGNIAGTTTTILRGGIRVRVRMFQETAEGVFVSTPDSVVTEAVRRARERRQEDNRVSLLAGPVSRVVLSAVRGDDIKWCLATDENGKWGLLARRDGKVLHFLGGGTTDDFSVLQATFDSPAEHAAAIGPLLRQAYKRVWRNWDIISIVASELQSRRHLTGREVRSIMRRHRRV